MSTVIEARRLNNTDLGKTISFPETEGVLRFVAHGHLEPEKLDVSSKYVLVIVDGENHVLEPSDKLTITARKAKPDA